MEEQFWQTRWAEGRIGFHEHAPNPFLTDHFDALALAPGSHIFVPLCGKTFDLDWLLERGHRVTGVEFNREAVDEVFERSSRVPEVEKGEGATRLSHGPLTLWQGDFFSLKPSDIGAVDAVYDRAALVALPKPLRRDYAARLAELTKGAPQLLISFSYDQSQTNGPPFSVPEAEIRGYYGDKYQIEMLDSKMISGQLAQRCDGEEQVWKLEWMGG